MATSQFTLAELDCELAYRQRFPPFTLQQCSDARLEQVTVPTLRRELAGVSPDDPDRDWLEYELALAARQFELFPDRLFARVVFTTDDPQTDGAA